MGLICILLLTDDVEHQMTLSFVCWPSVKCLFRSFARLSPGLSVSVICRSSLYILAKMLCCINIL